MYPDDIYYKPTAWRRYNYTEDQHVKYDSYVQELEGKGNKKPLFEGVLVLDEVKVVGNVAWNCKIANFVTWQWKTARYHS